MFNLEQFKSDVKSAEKRLPRDVIQCQSCYKSSLDGITLSKCGKCGIAYYCHKECQKNAWPRHKSACKILGFPKKYSTPAILKEVNDLRAFTAKVRPALMLWGLPAFSPKNDIKRGERDVLVANLRKRPDAKRPELAYESLDAYFKAIDSLPSPRKESVRAQVDNCQKDSISLGSLAGVVMFLTNVDSGVANAVPFAFDESLFVDHPQPGPLWKVMLIHDINSGKPLGSDLL